VQVAVVGAGFSGLMSAFLLEKILGPDIDIVIFESSGRLGGRICTLELGGPDSYYDSGAAELYEIAGGYSLKALVHALGLQTRDMVATPFFHFADALLRCEDDFQAVLGTPARAALTRFWELLTSMRTPDQYALAGHPADNCHPWSRQSFSETLRLIEDAQARHFTEVQVHSDVSTEPDLTTGLFGVDNLLVDHPDYVQMFTLVGGNEQLVHALAERISARVLLNAHVTQICAQRGGSYEVTYTGELTRRFHADYILVTPPPLSLDTICWTPTPLESAIRAHIRHHRYPADYVRVTLRTTERVWADELPEDYFVCQGLGGTTVYEKSILSDSQEIPILSLLIGGRHATELAHRPDGEVFHRVLQALPDEAHIDRNLVSTFRVDRWTNEVGVSRLPGGVPLRPLAKRHAPSADYPNVFMLGDYLYDTTINGALDACVFVTKSICENVMGRKVDSIEELLEGDGFLHTATRNGEPRRRPGRNLPFLARQ